VYFSVQYFGYFVHPVETEFELKVFFQIDQQTFIGKNNRRAKLEHTLVLKGFKDNLTADAVEIANTDADFYRGLGVIFQNRFNFKIDGGIDSIKNTSKPSTDERFPKIMFTFTNANVRK